MVPLISFSRKFSQANRYKVLNTPRPLLFFWVGINSSFFLREMSSKCLKCLEMLIDAWFFIFLIEATIGIDIVMREMQENYYLVLFMFARQLYFYVLGPISLLGY